MKSEENKKTKAKYSSQRFAKSLVAQLSPLGVSNGDIQGSNTPSPNYQIKNKIKTTFNLSKKAF
jgi:hypothetical protein